MSVKDKFLLPSLFYGGKRRKFRKFGAKTNLFKDLSKIYRNSLNLMEKNRPIYYFADLEKANFFIKAKVLLICWDTELCAHETLKYFHHKLSFY